jgi:signal transduction histidine kinase/CheY-like chemotaxis protein
MAAQLADLRRLHEMSERLSTTLELQPILEEALRTAAAMQGTDMGLLSLRTPEGDALELGASLGFASEFLRAIDCVPIGSGACGTCFQQAKRVIIEDTEADSVFEPYRSLASAAGFRAVHSVPLVTRAGVLLGVLSVHFREPRRPTDREMHLVDLCARQAADFIENAQLYAELRAADRRKDEFLAMLAHELRNPLAPLSNSLQILRLTEALPPAVESLQSVMENQVAHLMRLVDDLMEVSRITRGKIGLKKEPIELAAVVASAVEISRPLIQAAGHQLAINVSPEPIVLEADSVRLGQVISNLLNNAAKYTDEGGQIWLSARCEGTEAIISVKDTGIGIPQAMLPQVFNMFAQLDGTLRRARGGLGIGLTLAKSLVEMHGGRIEVRSDGPGTGSEFIVSLPCLVAPRTAGPAAPKGRHESQSLARRQILVVDDTHAAAHMLGRLLEKLGQSVQIANSAAEALQKVEERVPDLVISDLAMPEIDGLELARRIRQRPAVRGVTLVALTGYGQDSDRQMTREAGFDFHLVKPASVETLRQLLTSLPLDAADCRPLAAQTSLLSNGQLPSET